MVGILLHGGAHFLVVQEFLGVVAQVQHHRGAALGALDGFHGELALAVAFPAHALVGGVAGTAAEHLDATGDDKGGIEAHAELADQLGVLAAVAGHAGEKLLGAGAGDGTQIVDHLFPVHADAVVGDGERALVLVHREPDPGLRIVFQQLGVVERPETQFVAGVGGVGYQLAQENLTVAVQGVHHQVQKAGYFRLETTGFAVLTHRFFSAG